MFFEFVLSKKSHTHCFFESMTFKKVSQSGYFNTTSVFVDVVFPFNTI